MAYYKFKGFLAENGIKQKEVAEILGITPNNFSRKINRNGEDFTVEQIATMCRTYKLDANQFFLN